MNPPETRSKWPGCLLKVVLGVVGLILFLSTSLYSSMPDAVITLGLHLLAGWAMFIVSAVSEMRMEPVLLVNTLLGLLAACVFMHWVLIRVSNFSASLGRKWRWKWTLSLSAFVLLLFPLYAATSGVMHHGGNLMAEGFEHRYTRGSLKSLNLTGARLVADAAKAYADEHQGRWPRQITDLFTDEMLPSPSFARYGVFHTNGLLDAAEPWILLGGPPSGNLDLPLVVAPRPNENGLRVVAFQNGTAKECTEEEWQEALARWRRAMEADKPKAISETSR